ncbi:Uncharacterized protein TCM_002151 [Theobroma cacao]|uniref:Uncharacterized protein n=1 Tax=Theobroma cacao TaxID=3641 RepID=A0A061DTK5_THECC|nr:Uncharacterized protein TCM_002151 [Theobroma cacao]
MERKGYFSWASPVLMHGINYQYHLLKIQLSESTICHLIFQLSDSGPWGMRHPRNGIGYCLGTSITSWNF